MQMHTAFASRFLVDSLNKHGPDCLNSEVQRFEKRAALGQGNGTSQQANDKVVHIIADNEDHDIGTLDGHGTFHGMGIVVAIIDIERIRRTAVKTKDKLQVGKINIRYCAPQHTGILFLNSKELSSMEISDPTSNQDLLWDMSFLIRPTRP